MVKTVAMDQMKWSDNRKSGLKCIINTCQRSYRDGSEHFPVRLFKFPVNEFVRRQWVAKCKLDSAVNIDRAVICNKHFLQKYLGKKYLKAGAIPTLCVFDEPNLHLNMFEADENSDVFSFCDENETDNKISIFQHTRKHPAAENTSMNIVESPNIYENDNIGNSFDKVDADKSTDTIELCPSCLTREQNERYYRNKYWEMCEDIKKEKQKNKIYNKKIRQLKTALRNERARKFMYKREKKDRSNLFGIIEKKCISENSKTVCKMLMKNKQSWQEEEKMIAQSINFFSSKAYNFMRDDLELNLPSKSSLLRGHRLNLWSRA